MTKLLESAPYWVPVLLLIASSLANYLTQHHSTAEVGKLAELLLKVIERVSVLVSKDAPGTFKLPFVDKRPVSAPEQDIGGSNA